MSYGYTSSAKLSQTMLEGCIRPHWPWLDCGTFQSNFVGKLNGIILQGHSHIGAKIGTHDTRTCGHHDVSARPSTVFFEEELIRSIVPPINIP